MCHLIWEDGYSTYSGEAIRELTPSGFRIQYRDVVLGVLIGASKQFERGLMGLHLSGRLKQADWRVRRVGGCILHRRMTGVRMCSKRAAATGEAARYVHGRWCLDTAPLPLRLYVAPDEDPSYKRPGATQFSFNSPIPDLT